MENISTTVEVYELDNERLNQAMKEPTIQSLFIRRIIMSRYQVWLSIDEVDDEGELLNTKSTEKLEDYPTFEEAKALESYIHNLLGG